MDKRISENLNGIQQDYIAPFFWVHNEPDEKIIEVMQAIYDSGIRSVCIESRTHEEFCNEDWWTDMELIFEFCKEHNMRAWILDDKRCPSGRANNIFRDKYKDFKTFNIVEHHMTLQGPVKDCAAMATSFITDDDEIVAVAALKHIPDSDKFSEVIDITDGYSDGFVHFDLPEGSWQITFMKKTTKGRNQGSQYFVDMLQPQMVDLYLKEVYDPHYERLGKYFGNVFLGFFSDEPSFINGSSAPFFGVKMGVPKMFYPWKDELLNITDDRAKMAGLWFDIENVTDKIRFDFMDKITDEYRNNFTRKLGAWCREHGVLYIGHIVEDNEIHSMTGYGAGHFFRALDGQDMSGIDIVLNQILPGVSKNCHAASTSNTPNPRFYHYYLAKMGASYGHIDPLKKGRAMCEIFGAFGWVEGTRAMKYLMDHMLVRGINYYVPHAFSEKENDADCPPNFHDSGFNPEFKFFKYHMEYMQRVCHILNDGIHKSTCALLYDAENRWSNKDFLSVDFIAKELYDNLLDYDIIPLDYLDKIKDSTLNGEKYNVLFVPYSSVVSDYAKEQLKKADIEIIMVSEDGKRPKGCPYKWIKLSDVVKFMEKRGFREIDADYDDIYLRHYHYTRDGADIFMFVNEDIRNDINAKIKIPAFGGGKYVEYNAYTNEAVIKEGKKGEIEISLAPYNSTIIAFGDVSFEGAKEYKKVIYGEAKELTPEYKISLSELTKEEYVPYKTTKELFSITRKGEKPHFSGRMKYEAKINLPKSDLLLDLGGVGEVAEVYLNGKDLGVKPFPPYTFNISKEDIKDENDLTIIVTNHKGYLMKDGWSAYMPFEASGLLGPVTIKEKQ